MTEINMRKTVKITDFKTSDGHYHIPTFFVAYRILEMLGEDIRLLADMGDFLCNEIMDAFKAYRMTESQEAEDRLKTALGKYLDDLENSRNLRDQSAKEKLC